MLEYFFLKFSIELLHITGCVDNFECRHKLTYMYPLCIVCMMLSRADCEDQCVYRCFSSPTTPAFASSNAASQYATAEPSGGRATAAESSSLRTNRYWDDFYGEFSDASYDVQTAAVRGREL